MENLITNNKKIILIGLAVLLALGVIAGVYFYLSRSKITEKQALQNATGAADMLTESATKGALPSIETNPLENKPDINPADKANPYKDIKTNPFE